MSKILVVAAHPDDEILGCGGTVARMAKNGDQVYSLVLGEGVTSRDEKRDQENRNSEISGLKKEMVSAGKIIGVKELFTADFPDNRFDSVPLLDIIKEIERVKENVKPDIVFTHFGNDLNIDHKVTFDAVLTATRPLCGETVKQVYAFEILSSTEWNYPLSFSPNIYFDISKTIDLKKKAMEEYQSEIRDFPHPRSVQGIELSAKYWGMRVGLEYAEAFICVRSII